MGTVVVIGDRMGCGEDGRLNREQRTDTTRYRRRLLAMASIIKSLLESLI